MIFRSLGSNLPMTTLSYSVLALATVFVPLFTEGIHFSDEDTLLAAGLIKLPSMVQALLIAMLLSLNALVLNKVIRNREFHTSPGYFPGFLFLLFLMGTGNNGFDPGFLIGNIFFVISLNKLHQVFRENRAGAAYFESGFWLGVSGLFYPLFFPLLIFFAILDRWP